MGQADVLARARAEKFDGCFKGKTWRIVTEATGVREFTASGTDVKVTFTAGHFEITTAPGGKGAKFRTPLGHPGRSGYLVVEVDTEGNDTQNYAAFGETALRRAAEQYGAILNLPGAAVPETVSTPVHHVFDSDSGSASEGVK